MRASVLYLLYRCRPRGRTTVERGGAGQCGGGQTSAGGQGAGSGQGKQPLSILTSAAVAAGLRQDPVQHEEALVHLRHADPFLRPSKRGITAAASGPPLHLPAPPNKTRKIGVASTTSRAAAAWCVQPLSAPCRLHSPSGPKEIRPAHRSASSCVREFRHHTRSRPQNTFS